MAALLPPLREDLQLKQTELDKQGRPTWVIHDPARNRFFSLDWLSSELLKRWRLRDAQQVLNSINNETTIEADEQDLQELASFLERNELLQVYSSVGTDRLIGRSEKSSKGVVSRLLKHYLYFRVPLLNPEPLLRAFAWCVKPLGSVWFTRLTFIALVFGLFQLGRRWDGFTHSFSQIFNLESLVLVGLIVVLVKVLHEFGHAFAAFNRGCRVPRMGVVFLVMFPVAYTDVTDSWKLSPRDRMAIGLAGIRVELAVAAWATLLWGLVPPGGLRDGLFLILTVTWLGTLLINASPFMRFDGYFVLMDYWRVPNLHQRAGALGRWWLRKVLLGSQQSAPEYLAKDQQRLILFAYLSWSYRLVVFGGIAWLVYQLFPQPFGLLMAGIEIYWFILKPIFSELKAWPKLLLGSLMRPHSWGFLLMLVLVGVALFYPWRDSFTVRGVLLPERELAIEAKQSALLVEVHGEERELIEGDLIARFENPELVYERERLDIRQRKLEWMLSQQSFVSQIQATGMELQAQLIELQQEQRALEKKLNELELRAPITGYFRPGDDTPAPGDWVDIGTEFGKLSSADQRVSGYLTASQRYWLAPNTDLFWKPDMSDTELKLTNPAVANQAVEKVDIPLLLRFAGGDIAARRSADGWIPDEAIYRFDARLQPNIATETDQVMGPLELPARPHSLWMLLTEAIKQQLQQDFGFGISQPR